MMGKILFVVGKTYSDQIFINLQYVHSYHRSGIETRLQNAVFHLLRTKAPAQWLIHSHQTRQQEPLAYMLKIQVRSAIKYKGSSNNANSNYVIFGVSSFIFNPH